MQIAEFHDIWIGYGKLANARMSERQARRASQAAHSDDENPPAGVATHWNFPARLKYRSPVSQQSV
jgi:hypothetical protein